MRADANVNADVNVNANAKVNAMRCDRPSQRQAKGRPNGMEVGAKPKACQKVPPSQAKWECREASQKVPPR